MADPSKLFAHRRVVYPMPTGAVWNIGCGCGWKGHVSLVITAYRTQAEALIDLDRFYAAHLPQDHRRLYVKIDRRAGQEGQWLMPEGVPCRFDRFYESDGEYHVHLVEPVQGDFPAGEVIVEDGRIFRMD